MNAPVVAFVRIRMTDVPSAGGKGASLGEMTSAGLPVPGGYVVTTGAFEQALAALDPNRHIRFEVGWLDAEDHTAVREASARLRARIEEAPLREHLIAPIVAEYARLCGDQADRPVAVRSSATSEDSSDASFAGMQDTFLWVRGADAVVHAVRSCWASLYSVESISYRLRLHVPESTLAMAVVVQRMVDARSAGVMFTRAPASGDRSVVAVEASWGLGSCVVSGEVTPDAFVLNKVTKDITSRKVAHKERWHRPDPSGSGVLDEPLPADRQDVPSVGDAELSALLDLAVQVEKHYGMPMDIEWAVDAADGTVYLLQARPETVWTTRDGSPAAAPRANPFDHVIAKFGAKAKSQTEHLE